MLVTGSGFAVLANSFPGDVSDDKAEAVKEEIAEDAPDEDFVRDSNSSEETGTESSAQKEKQIVKQTIEADVANDGAAVSLTGKMPEDAVVKAETAEAEVDGEETVAAYDITIYSGDDSAAEEWEPETDIKVSISDESLAGIEDGREVSVYHIPDGSDEHEFVCTAKVKGGEVKFTAESFSIYVITQAPEPYTPDTSDEQTLEGLASDAGDAENNGRAFRLSIINNGTRYYFTNTLTNKTDGYVIARTTELASAADWYFEKTDDADKYYLFTLNGDERKYIKVKDNTFLDTYADDSADATAFNASLFRGVEGAFLFLKDGEATTTALNHSGRNSGFKCYRDVNVSTNTDCKVYLTYSPKMPDDEYGFGGKSYGLMYYDGGSQGYGMLSGIVSSNRLGSEKLLVRSDPMDQNRVLYVSNGSSIADWTFTNVREDLYYLTSGDGQYMRIEGNSFSLVSKPDDYCFIKVIPGSGNNEGKVKLIGERSGSSITCDKGRNNFTLQQSAVDRQWLNLVDDSVYGDDDFITYSAYKVSVSDRTNMANGKQVVIYTRVWNDTDKAYEFYAVDHNGDLIRAYESGDTITWIGTQNNTLLWDFTEYYEPGTTTPNNYYELQNSYTGKYLAPQIGGGQVFSDNTIGLQLNGRKDGEYFTTILSWDDRHYDYAGLKTVTQDGVKKLASCPMAQAETFYFAVIELEEPAGYTEVETVDHNELGLTMKMVNYGGHIISGGGNNSPTTKTQNDVIGTNFFSQKNPQQGLLSTDLKENGYPVATNTEKSLSQLYTQAIEVNNLFVKSVHEGSGYYQFDSTENFAHLNGQTRKFEVYQELGTVPGTSSHNTRHHGQFMPYNSLSDTKEPRSGNDQNLTDIYGDPLSDNYPRKNETLYSFNEEEDYYFGMEVEGSFMQTPSGKDNWGHDIVFEFVGDDDFWMYVDGELVIDLGGIHSALGASVNYSNGKVVVNGKETTLYDLFKKNYAAREGLAETDQAVIDYANGIFREKEVDGETCHVFRDYSTHHVRIFYMERGAGASNLRMRFNMATVNPGEVLLSKEIKGTDKQDFASVSFPFQIYHVDQNGDEKLLTNEPDPVSGEYPVTPKTPGAQIDYKDTVTIGGKTYNSVFYLKPGQTAAIHFPDNTEKYKIVECGVDTSIYDTTEINGEAVTGTSAGTGRVDYETTYDTISDRRKVTFSNHVSESNLRTLTVTKKLFDSEGEEVTAEEDGTGFKLRLYLGDDPENLSYYNTGDYYVKNPDGYYCFWNEETQKFESTGKKEFSQFTTQEEIDRITYRTSPSGAADKLPAGYSIEVRGLLVGTSFKVVEEDHDIPVGYGKRSWTEDGREYYCYKRVDGSYISEEGEEENTGTIAGGDNPRIEVHNQKGYGIRADRVWSDADFMTSHDNTSFAVFVGDSEVPLAGSVKTVTNYDYATWFFASLQDGATFEDYNVREVEADSSGGYRIIEGDERITLGGTDKDGEALSGLEYTASYEQGSTETGSTFRTDTVTNTRLGGLKIVKTDMTGTGLSGAGFKLEKNGSGGGVIGKYTSGNDGLVTTAYLSDGTYTLTETKAPKAYSALSPEVTITVDNGSFTVRGSDEDGFDYDAEHKTLTLRNRPFTLRVVKNDYSDPEMLLEGAHFALYRQIAASSGNVRKDYYPIEGYEDLATGADGIVPGVDQGLKAGTYYLTETAAPYGYDLGSPVKEVVFTISGDGKVTIEEGSSYTGSLSKKDVKDDSGEVIIRTDYTISVPNAEEGQIVPSGIVTGLWRAVGSLALILFIIVAWIASKAVRRRTAR